jgi:ribosomal protein L11 methyltransferase
MNPLDRQILHYVSESQASVTFRRLQRHFKTVHQVARERLKQAVKRLVQAGRLGYRTDFGTSYLDIAINGPVKVSEHVFLKPPMRASVAAPGQLDIVLEEGAAFGRGDHPSTRLAIQLIDGLLHDGPWQKKKTAMQALDIGTGSGVLSIVAAKMGVGRIQAVDVDPCAVFEARTNVQLNAVEGQVVLINDLEDVGRGGCDLILANLRTPTLMILLPQITEMVKTESVLILSGIHPEETDALCDRYRKAGFFRIKMCAEKGWRALLFARGDFRGDRIEGIPSH